MCLPACLPQHLHVFGVRSLGRLEAGGRRAPFIAGDKGPCEATEALQMHFTSLHSPRLAQYKVANSAEQDSRRPNLCLLAPSGVSAGLSFSAFLLALLYCSAELSNFTAQFTRYNRCELWVTNLGEP